MHSICLHHAHASDDPIKTAARCVRARSPRAAPCLMMLGYFSACSIAHRRPFCSLWFDLIIMICMRQLFFSSMVILSTRVLITLTQFSIVVEACRICLLNSHFRPSVAFSLGHSRHPLFTEAIPSERILPLNMFNQPEEEKTWDVSKQLRTSDRTDRIAQQEFIVSDDSSASSNNEQKQDVDTVPTAILLGSIQFYKNFISPVLPRACRFLPTCSSYGLEAIQTYGAVKGTILTAWRIFRCSPFGGRGYDPPVWPPVPYNFQSY